MSRPTHGRPRTTRVASAVQLCWHVALSSLATIAPLPLLAQFIPGGGDGYRFSAPLVTLSLRGGLDRPMARSDIFDLAVTNFTFGRGDLAAAGAQLDLALRAAPRLDVVLSGGYAARTAQTVYRDFVDNNDREIEQSTELRRTPLSIGVRAALMAPGERIGKFAWIPSRFTPWIGAGGGVMLYQFRQKGDFVNPSTLAVGPATLRSRGSAPMAYANVGAEWSLSSRLAISGDLRYTASRGSLDQNTFRNFSRIDLSGAAATMGLAIRY